MIQYIYLKYSSKINCRVSMQILRLLSASRSRLARASRHGGRGALTGVSASRCSGAFSSLSHLLARCDTCEPAMVRTSGVDPPLVDPCAAHAQVCHIFTPARSHAIRSRGWHFSGGGARPNVAVNKSWPWRGPRVRLNARRYMASSQRATSRVARRCSALRASHDQRA